MIDKIRFKCNCDSISTGVCYCYVENELLETYKVKLSTDPDNDHYRSYTGKLGTEKDIALEYIEWCWQQRDGWEWMSAASGHTKIIVQSLITNKTTVFEYVIESEPCFYVKEIKQ
jgi:hypothetical protein